MPLYISHPERRKLIHNDDFLPDFRHDRSVPMIHLPEEYVGSEQVALACTQHSGVSEYRQKKITSAWVDFLTRAQYPMKTVQLCTRTPQTVFDAVCTQKGITSLRFKWVAAPNINAIADMRQLKHLQIECGSAICDLAPLAALNELETLVLGSTVKVTDYSPIGKLKKLKTLVIGSYPTRDDRMTMESDDFLTELSELQYLGLEDVRLVHRTLLTPEFAEHYTYASFEC